MSLRLLNWNDTRGMGSRRERVDHHRHHLDVVVERQVVAPDDVDVGLGELPVAALLRSLAAPGRLHLEAPERELEVSGVLEDVARERHGEVEVQAEVGLRAGLGRDPLEDVDLLVDLAALGQALDGLDDPRLDVGEAVQLEGARQRRDHLALDGALGRQQLGEPAQRADLAHQRSWIRSWRKGLVARSRPIEVCSPWPGQHDDVVGERQDLVGQAAQHRRVVAAGQVGAADGAGEEEVAGEHQLRDVLLRVRRAERHRALGVAGGVVDDEPQAGQLELGEVRQLAHVVGLGPRVVAAEQHLGGLGAHPGHRVAEQVAVAGVDPGGRVVGAGDRRDAPHVVDVPVGDEHADGLEAVLAHHLGDAVGGVLAGIDDHALAAGTRRHDVAVGPPGSGGEASDEHRRQSLLVSRSVRVGSCRAVGWEAYRGCSGP